MYFGQFLTSCIQVWWQDVQQWSGVMGQVNPWLCCQQLCVRSNTRWQRGAGSRGAGTVLSPALRELCAGSRAGWFLPPWERLFITVNNGRLVWERALNQLFLLSYRCLFFKAMYSPKHIASVTKIATEQPSQFITRLPDKESFVAAVWGAYSGKTWRQYIKNCSLSFKHAWGCTTLARHTIFKCGTVAVLSCPLFRGGW